MSQSLKSPAPSPDSPAKPAETGPSSKSLMTRAMARPEIGAFIAAVVLYIFFFIVAPPFRSLESFSTVLYASSTIGIVAVGVGLLMIGGEFDLSAGVAAITYGLTTALLCYQLTLNMWVGAIVSLLLAFAIGWVNGYLVVRTGIPSFLVTLGTFFVLQGANLGVTKLMTGSVASQNVADIDGF